MADSAAVHAKVQEKEGQMLKIFCNSESRIYKIKEPWCRESASNLLIRKMGAGNGRKSQGTGTIFEIDYPARLQSIRLPDYLFKIDRLLCKNKIVSFDRNNRWFGIRGLGMVCAPNRRARKILAPSPHANPSPVLCRSVCGVLKYFFSGLSGNFVKKIMS
jgi:hypothetical protein